MAYDTTKLVKLAALKALAQKVQDDYATKVTVGNLEKRINEIVATGGEPNVINKILVNGVEQSISEAKGVDITMPTKVSDLTNDSKFQTDTEVAAAIAAADHMKRKIVTSTDDIDLEAADASQYIYMVPKSKTKTGDKYDEYMVLDGVLEKVGDWEIDLSNYVQKDGDKVLSTNDFTNELLEKLNGIEAGANKYTHATHEAHASGFWKVTVDAEGHVSAVEAVAKEDITALGIPGQDTTYVVATTTADGLMAAADKAKLDGISEGANKVEASTTQGNIKIDGVETKIFEVATDAEVTEMLGEVFTSNAE